MVVETFDNNEPVTASAHHLTPAQKERARIVAAGTMLRNGYVIEEMYEVISMLGILPHPEECICGDC